MNSFIHIHHTYGELTISDDGIRWANGEIPDQWSNEDEAPAENMPSYIREHGENVVIMDWTGEETVETARNGALAKFFSFTKGKAEFVFVAENGHMVGVRVEDGRMSVHKLKLDLGQKLDDWKTVVEVENG